VTEDSIVLAALGGLALLAIVLVVALLRLRTRTGRALEVAYAETEALRARLDQLEERLATPEPPARPELSGMPEYTITALGRPEEPDPEPPTIDRALFADLVLRETVVKAGGLVHGVRRALAPETRNRIRFEVRREIRRSRKQRKADLREARREWESRQRAAMTDDEYVA
jgi:hypothetical protein